MLANIEPLCIIAAMAFGFVFTIMCCVQWSAYEDHRKKHAADDPESKSFRDANRFSVVPYFMIPLAFCVLAVAIGMFIGDYTVSSGIVRGSEGIAICVVGASIVAYVIMDYGIVSRVGDAAYFRFIESAIVKAVVRIDPEDLTDDERDALLTGRMTLKQILKARQKP